MGKTLIITEKPSVAREYAAILGVKGRGQGVIANDQYVITWCVGHLVEMCYPEVYDAKYKNWNLKDLPFLPETYRYDVISSVKQQYEVVNRLMNSEEITTILYAGDSGREGQVIIELIRMFGGVRQGMEEKRIWIDSCTEEEILRGIREAKQISAYDNLASAGILRGIEDYAMGINFSRALSVKYGRMLNKAAANKKYAAVAIGRVMTCVLGMVVRREREIREFKETPFYRVLADLGRDEASFSAEWKSDEKSLWFESPALYKENGFLHESDARKLIEQLAGKTAIIEEVKKTTEKKKPPLLFNLAELQAECSKQFKISPEETLKVAQNLYEKKFTTYPRTDARVLTSAIAKEIVKNLKGLAEYPMCRGYIRTIAEKKLHKGLEKSQYTDDKRVTDHYAIIPTGYVKGLEGLSELEKKVYDLIVIRFLRIFYPPAVYQKVNLVLRIDKEGFSTSVKVLKDQGYLAVTAKASTVDADEEGSRKDDNRILLKLVSSFKKGDNLDVRSFETKEGKTSPPKRYTSGSMVLAMENAGKLIEDEELRAQIKGAGIGTSATRAGIIEKLIRIGYLNLNKKTQVLRPENFGEMIYEAVLMTLPSMLNPEMTASWEKGLAGVEQGEITVEKYRTTLDSFVNRNTKQVIAMDGYYQLSQRIRPFAVGEGYEYEGRSDRQTIDAVCPICGSPVETYAYGYRCSRYGNCSFSIGRIARKMLSEDEATKLIRDKKLEKAEGFISRAGKPFSAGLILEEIVTETGEKRMQAVFDFARA